MIRRILLGIAAALIGGPLGAQSPQQLATISLSVGAYPDHSLPAIPPSLQINITNAGTTAITLPAVHLCLHAIRPDGSTAAINCRVGDLNVDNPSTPLQFTGSPETEVHVGARATWTTYVRADGNTLFLDPSVCQPGTYQLQFFLNGTTVSSNTIRYVVEAPAGENSVVWSAMLARLPENPQPYLDERLTPVFAAHPGSDYAKVWNVYRDMINHGRLSDFAQRLQGYIANNPPVAFDGLYRVQLAETDLAIAEETIRHAGSVTDAAVQFAEQGRTLLEALASGTDPCAASLAAADLKGLPWTRQQLQQWLDASKPKAYIPVVPHADCVVRNTDGL